MGRKLKDTVRRAVAASLVVCAVVIPGCAPGSASTPAPVVSGVDAVVGADTAYGRSVALDAENDALRDELAAARTDLEELRRERDAAYGDARRLKGEVAEGEALALVRDGEIASLEDEVADLESVLEGMTPSTEERWEGVESPVWTAVNSRGDQASIDAGNLVRWDTRYYAAHAWTSYGRWTLAADVGDTVTIDGVTLRVVAIFTLRGDTSVEDVRENAGWDSYVMQTCEDEGNRWHRHLVLEPVVEDAA